MQPHATRAPLTRVGLWIVACALALAATPTWAELEVIELDHRPAAELVPVIEPFLDADDVVRAHGFQLIIRASPARLKQVRQIIARLDSAPQQLRITVRQTRQTVGHDEGGQAGARLSQGGAQLGGRVYSTESREAGGGHQQLRVMEGKPALIQFGQAVPVGERTVTVTERGTHVQDTVRYEEVTTGFYVLPRVRGDRVILHISPHRLTLSEEDGGVVNLQQVTTTVTGPLGRWIDLGGTVEEVGRGESGAVYRTRERSEQQGHVQVKVERVAEQYPPGQAPGNMGK